VINAGVAELKGWLKGAGLKQTGRKDELQERLLALIRGESVEQVPTNAKWLDRLVSHGVGSGGVACVAGVAGRWLGWRSGLIDS